MAGWARLALHLSQPPPWDLPRWIGVAPKEGVFQDHALVMSGDAICFDPAFIMGVTTSYSPTEIRTGLSFEPL